MKVLENHFDGNPTIFVNGRIINGCQDFTLDEAPAVFEAFGVPEQMQKDVYDNYVETSTDEEILKYVNSPDPLIRLAVAEQGVGLDTLMNDDERNVRIAVARQGYGLEKLVDDGYLYVRRAVAEQGYGLEKLVNDEFWVVRRAAEKASAKLTD